MITTVEELPPVTEAQPEPQPAVDDAATVEEPMLPAETGESGEGQVSDVATAEVDEIEVATSAYEGGLAAATAEVAEVAEVSALPAATAELYINLNRSNADSATITLREDGPSAAIDVIRTDISTALTLRVEEAGFSGNRSPWVSGQFSMTGDGYLEFAAGQERARFEIEMTSDPLREADQQSTLRLREADTATSQLATITLNLEDDDQRAFEATMPANTVAFASTQITVRERDPAVQVDILRFNPDNTRLEIHYRLRDITATKGEDYFEPGNDTIEFGPGQRTARLLIPLVQDVAFEDNEAFKVELMRVNEEGIAEVYAETAVIIRDDDS